MMFQQNARSYARVPSILMHSLTLLAVLLLASVEADTDGLSTHTSRRGTNVGRVMVGTVLNLSERSPEKLQTTHEILSGYRLWVEQTNRKGGILVGDTHIKIALEVHDCEGSEALQDAMYRQLVDDGVDFLLGGGENSTRSMIEAARARNVVSIASSADPSPWNAAENPATFAVFPPSQPNAAVRFVRSVRDVWSLRRMAVVGVGSIDGPSGRECREMLRAVNQSGIDVEMIEQSWVEIGDSQSLLDAMSRVHDADADFLVACTADEEEAEAIVRAASQAILRGWNIHNQLQQCTTQAQQLCKSKQSVTPQVIESTSLKFMFFTAGASRTTFTDNVDGWAEKVASPVLWHPDLKHSDPLFGSAKELNALWTSRFDLGNGRSMSEHAAVAAASGLALGMAIEAAGSIEAEEVADGMRSLDVETFFGRIRMGAADGTATGNINTGLESPIAQWDCSSVSQCVLQIPAVANPIRPYRLACPVNSLWNSTEELVRPADPAAFLRQLSSGRYRSRACVPCLQGDMRQLGPMLADQSNMQSLTAACPATFHPIHVGVAAKAIPGDQETMKGVLATIERIKVLPGLSFITTLVGIKTIPLPLPAITPLASEPGNATSTTASGEAAAVNASAGRAAYATLLKRVSVAPGRGVVIWNEGLVTELGLEEQRARSACEGGGMQVEWGQLGLCMTPATRLQGRALADLVEYFRWKRLHLVVDSDPASQQMLGEFQQVAEQLNLQPAELILIPDDSDAAGQQEAMHQIEQLDDCRATVVVMLVTRRSAYAIFERVLGGDEAPWSGDRRFVVIGNEAATRATNAPQGMLGLRTVAMHEGLEAALIMAGSGGAHAHRWGTGVGLSSEAAAWEDIGVEDRMLFAADALRVIIIAIARSQFLGRPATLEEMEEAVLGINTQSIDFEGATGLFKFAAANRTSGQRIFERVAGRFSFVNKRHDGWRAIATLDMDRHEGDAEVTQGSIVQTVNVTLGQREWEDTAVDWGLAAKSSGGKPDDTCECVVWSKMGPHSRLSSCRWSTEAVSVVVGAKLVMLGVAVAVWWFRRERVEEAEKVIRHRVQELRTRLKLDRKDGFFLSTERRGLLRLLFGRTDQAVEIQHQQLEALARMTLWKRFAKEALDSLVWMLKSQDRTLQDRLGSTGSMGTLLTALQVTQMEEPTRAESPRQMSPLASLWPRARMSPQLKALRALILETSRMLLDPKYDRQNGEEESKEKASAVLCACADTMHQEDRLDHNIQALDSAFKPRSRKFRRIKMAEEHVSGVDRRFKFFAEHVAQLQVWLDEDGSLFHELKEDIVQGFMDAIHAECDRVFESMLEKENGRVLAQFPHAAAPALLRNGLGLNKSRLPLRSGSLRILADLGPCHPDFRGTSSSERRSPSPSVESPRVTGALDSAPHGELDALLIPPATTRRKSRSSDLKLDFQMDSEMSGLDFPLHQVGQSLALRARGRGVAWSEAPAEAPAPSPAPAQLEAHREEGDGAVAHAKAEAPAEKVLRQDDPRVTAIRLSDDDWKEIDIEKSAAALTLFPAFDTPVADEEIYISQLHRRASVLNNGFQDCVRQAIEHKFWGRMRVEGAPVKTKSRMREKILSYASPSLAGMQYGDETQLPLAANILDPIRATVLCNGPEEMLEVAWWLLEEGATVGLPVARVKNKFAMRDASEYDGYRDIMMCVVFTGKHGLRVIAEIQIHDSRLHKLKREMHKLYKVKRATRATNIL